MMLGRRTNAQYLDLPPNTEGWGPINWLLRLYFTSRRVRQQKVRYVLFAFLRAVSVLRELSATDIGTSILQVIVVESRLLFQRPLNFVAYV
jgi:hypothetical protein